MSLEPESGKSIASLGLMEMLSRHVDKVGYFRPVIRESDTRDVTIELMRSRYNLAQSYDESFGVTTGQTVSYTHLDVYKRQPLSRPVRG